jgi:hypothetical protein
MDGSSYAHIYHHMIYTWGRLWSSPRFGPALLVLPPWIQEYLRTGEISRLTTLFRCKEMGTYTSTNLRSFHSPLLTPCSVFRSLFPITGAVSIFNLFFSAQPITIGVAVSFPKGGVRSGSRGEFYWPNFVTSTYIVQDNKLHYNTMQLDIMQCPWTLFLFLLLSWIKTSACRGCL